MSGGEASRHARGNAGRYLCAILGTLGAASSVRGGGVVGVAPALVALAAMLACGSPSRSSLVLVTLDTLRADRLGSYGYVRDTSPALDRFAAGALLFENAIAPMATTLPSHVSIMTGVHPVGHGVLSNHAYLQRPLETGEGLRTMAQMLQEAGYGTGGFVSASPLSRATGIDVGFDRFHAPDPWQPGREGTEWRAWRTVDAALEWLDEVEPPFFAWVHLFDPHRPYAAPPPFLGSFESDESLRAEMERIGIPESRTYQALRVSNRYDEEVRYMDQELGRLLRYLEQRGLPELVVVVAADHGEGLWQHDVLEHGVLYQEQIRVPLLLRLPGGPEGRSDALASLVDVLPTLAAHTDLPLDGEQSDGRDLLDGGRDAALSQRALRKHWPELNFTLTEPDWKYWYFEKQRDRLYHLAADPHELRDVIAGHPERAARMRAELLARVERYRSREPLRVSDEIPPALREQLRALGYVE